MKLRLVVASILLLLVPMAQAIDVYYCTAPIPGQHLGCSGSTGVASELDVIPNGYAVASCKGGTAEPGDGFSDCAPMGGTLEYRYPNQLAPGDEVTSAASGEEGLLRAAEEFSFFLVAEELPGSMFLVF